MMLILALNNHKTIVTITFFVTKYCNNQLSHTSRHKKKEEEDYGSYSYKEKDMSPSIVTKGRASVLDISHFSLDFRTPHTNILVYKK